MGKQQDVETLRALAGEYMLIADMPVQNERRELWSQHFSLKPVRPPILASMGWHNKWCREYFSDDAMQCESPLLRDYERRLKMALFQQTIGDDAILEPWLTVGAHVGDGWDALWGVQTRYIPPTTPDGAWKHDPAIKTCEDAAKMQVPHHVVDEDATRLELEQIEEAVGDIIPVCLSRGPRCWAFGNDLITHFSLLRGLEEIMLDMCINPEWLHGVMAFMRDGVLTNQQEAEDAGDISLLNHVNQAMPYCEELEWPRADSGPRNRSQVWGFCAAQELALVSTEMHDEFVLQYQLPIISKFGFVHYGCCEDLTRKIDMLRQIPNLRSIAVAPSADIASCAEQIKGDYAFSWRPSPAEMVCSGFDPDHIRNTMRQTFAATRGCHVHIHLKDIETLSGDLTRLPRWVRIVREEIDKAGL